MSDDSPVTDGHISLYTVFSMHASNSAVMATALRFPYFSRPNEATNQPLVMPPRQSKTPLKNLTQDSLKNLHVPMRFDGFPEGMDWVSRGRHLGKQK